MDNEIANTLVIAEDNQSKVNMKNLMKFIIGSGFGVLMFLVPVSQGESFTTLISYVTDFIKDLLGGSLSYIIMGLIIFSAVMSTIDYIFKPDFIRKNENMKKAFSTSLLYLISKIIGAIVTVMVVFNIGPEMIISIDTGGTMVSLCGTLFCIVFSLSFILPFLTDCGIMEFLGVVLKPVVRPLFKVPGRASVDLMASWFGASNAAVILTREQYMNGFYTKREAGYITTNFSIVSIPFCLLVAETLGISKLFPAFYLVICVVGIILAVIMCRIPPISSLPDTYHEKSGRQINEEIPSDKGLLAYAIELSCVRAEKFTAKTVGIGGMHVVIGMLFDLIPIVIAWGTIGLIVVNFTPIFNWISYPMGVYMNLLGVEDAFAAAPATLVGFADMFIPALLLSSCEFVKTKFIVGVLSLVQIIYLTEVGVIIMKSEIPLNLWKLFIIFIERTIIALPIIVLLTNLLIR